MVTLQAIDDILEEDQNQPTGGSPLEVDFGDGATATIRPRPFATANVELSRGAYRRYPFMQEHLSSAYQQWDREGREANRDDSGAISKQANREIVDRAVKLHESENDLMQAFWRAHRDKTTRGADGNKTGSQDESWRKLILKPGTPDSDVATPENIKEDQITRIRALANSGGRRSSAAQRALSDLGFRSTPTLDEHIALIKLEASEQRQTGDELDPATNETELRGLRSMEDRLPKPTGITLADIDAILDGAKTESIRELDRAAQGPTIYDDWAASQGALPPHTLTPENTQPGQQASEAMAQASDDRRTPQTEAEYEARQKAERQHDAQVMWQAMKEGRLPDGILELAGMVAREQTKGHVRGAVKGVAGVPQAIAIAANKLDEVAPWGEPGKELDEYATYKYGEWIKKFNDMIPADPLYEREFAHTLAEGVGQLGVGIAGGMATKAIGATGAGTAIPMAASGMGQQGSEQYKAALAHGVSEQEASNIAFWSGLVEGTLEAIPVGRVLARMNKASGGGLMRSVRRLVMVGLAGGLEEGITETAQETAGNLFTRIYDEDQEILEGVGTAGAAGGVLGFMANFALGMIGVKRPRLKVSDVNTPEGTLGFTLANPEAALKIAEYADTHQAPPKKLFDDAGIEGTNRASRNEIARGVGKAVATLQGRTREMASKGIVPLDQIAQPIPGDQPIEQPAPQAPEDASQYAAFEEGIVDPTEPEFDLAPPPTEPGSFRQYADAHGFEGKPLPKIGTKVHKALKAGFESATATEEATPPVVALEERSSPGALVKPREGEVESAQEPTSYDLYARLQAEAKKHGLKAPGPNANQATVERYEEALDKLPKLQALQEEIATARRREGGQEAAKTKKATYGVREQAKADAESGNYTPETMVYAHVGSLPAAVRQEIQNMANALIARTKSKKAKAALKKIVEDGTSDKGGEVEKQKRRIVNSLSGESDIRSQQERQVGAPQPMSPVIEVMTERNARKRNTAVDAAIASIKQGQPNELAAHVENSMRPEGDPFGLIGDESIELLMSLKASETAGEQESLGFARDVEGSTDTGQGWVTSEGRLRPDTNTRAEAAQAKEDAKEGQTELIDMVKPKNKGLSAAKQLQVEQDAARKPKLPTELGMGPQFGPPQGPPITGPDAAMPDYATAPDPAIEARLAKADGVPTESFLKGIWNRAKSLGRKMTRAYEHIPKKDEFAPALELFRLSGNRFNASSDEAVRTTASIVNMLNPVELKLFSRAVVIGDLLASRDKQNILRFGFKSWSDLEAYNTQLQQGAVANPKIAQALENRKKVANELTRRLVDIGLLDESALDNPEYYHRQVLSYYEAGRGDSRSLQLHKKPFQKRRVSAEDVVGQTEETEAGEAALGEEADYNTNYVEAETQWITHALQQIALKETLNEIQRIYDIMPQIRAKVKRANYVAVVGGESVANEIARLKADKAQLQALPEKDSSDRQQIAQINEQLDEIDPYRPYDIQIGKGFGMLQNALENGGGEALTAQEWNELNDIGEVPFSLVRKVAATEGDVASIAARTVLKAVKEKQAFTRETLGHRFKTPMSELKASKTHSAWRAESGNVFYAVLTIPERLFAEAEAANKNQLEVPKELVKTQRAMGGERPSMALPTEIVTQLEEMGATGTDSTIPKDLMNAWKQWTLMNPKRVLGYNLRNMTGDLDPVIATHPGIVKYAPQATKELWSYYHDSLSMTDDVRSARDLAVLDSAQVATEMGDLKKLRLLQRFFKAQAHDATAKRGAISQVAELPAKYFEIAKRYTQIRENILRLSTYKYYMRAFKTGQKIHYGGANPKFVRRIRKVLGNEVAAAHLARNLIGDYGNLTVMGNYMRERIAPFWSWVEINLKRTPRLALNAYEYGGGYGVASHAVRGLAMSRIFWLYAAMHLYNSLVWPDEEDDLSPAERASPHIITGRNSDGTIMVLRNTGAIGDAIEWLGTSTLRALLPEYLAGQITGKKLAKEMAKESANKFAQGLNPFIKTGVETATGQSYFPDAFNPRRQERDTAAAGLVGLQDEYREVKGRILNDGSSARPHYLDRLIGIVDPRRESLYAIYGMIDNWNEKQGKGTGGSYARSPFHTMREAGFNDDFENFKKARRVYMENGFDYDNFKRSLKRLDPLYGRINQGDREEFVNQFMTDRDRATLDEARRAGRDLEVRLWEWWQRAAKSDSPEQQAELSTELTADMGRAAYSMTSPSAKEADYAADWATLQQQGVTYEDLRDGLKVDWKKRGYVVNSNAHVARIRKLQKITGWKK